jgi:hypothetical protein
VRLPGEAPAVLSWNRSGSTAQLPWAAWEIATHSWPCSAASSAQSNRADWMSFGMTRYIRTTSVLIDEVQRDAVELLSPAQLLRRDVLIEVEPPRIDKRRSLP